MKLEINPKDSLLIIYNGHAEVDSNSLYWIPSHGKRDQIETWFNTSAIFDFIKPLDIAHVALIVNCCNSANLYNQQKNNNVMLDVTEGKSRVLLTSGKINQTVDDNSSFTEGVVRYFDEANDEFNISLDGLSGYLKRYLYENKSYQEPIFMPFHGHQGGDFNFILSEDDESYWIKQNTIGTIEAYHSYIGRFKNGKFLPDAKMRINQLKEERKKWLDTLQEVEENFQIFKIESENLNGKFKINAQSHIDSINKEIIEQTRYETIDIEWVNLQISDNPDDFKKFNEKYPNNKYKGIAERKEKDLKKEKDAKIAWEEALAKTELRNRRNALTAFIKYYSPHYKIREAKEREEDLSDYLIAESEPDREKRIIKFEKYKQRPIRCDYKDRADKQILKLKAENQLERFNQEFESALQENNISAFYEIERDIKYSFTTQTEIQNLESIYEKVRKLILEFEIKRKSDFDNAVKSQRVSNLVAFIETYKDIEDNTDVTYATKATNIFYEKEKECYDSCDKYSIEDFEYYLSEFEPFENIITLDFIDKVRKEHGELRKDKSAFDNATSYDKLKLYISNVNSQIYVGKYLDVAEDKIKRIELEQRKQSLYDSIMQKSSILLCEEFLNEFGIDNDEKTEDVKSKLIYLEMVRDREKSYLDILNEEDLSKKIELCTSFLDKYNDDEDGQYTEIIKEAKYEAEAEELDNKAFKEIEKSETFNDRLLAAENYLSKENPRHPEKAEFLKIESIAEIEKDNKEFDIAKSLESIDDKIEAIEHYLNRNKPVHKVEAELLFIELKLEKEDNEAYLYAEKYENTPTGWMKYIRFTKNIERKNIAISKRDELIKINDEQEMFEIVKAQKSKDVCLQYFEKYKNGNNRLAVEKLFAQIISGIEDITKESESEKIQKALIDSFKPLEKWLKIGVGVIVLLILIVIIASLFKR